VSYAATLILGTAVYYGKVFAGERNAAGNIVLRFEIEPAKKAPKPKKEPAKYVSTIDPQHTIGDHHTDPVGTGGNP
jgi:hypothetical protein